MAVKAHSKLWLIPPIIIGVVALIVAKNLKQSPATVAQTEPAKTVRVLQLKKQDFTPIATGYGTVQASQNWKAISQVSARITQTNNNLNNGSFVKKDDLLVQLDPVDYELNLAQAQVQLTEIEVNEQNTQASIAIDERNLALAEKEYKRLKTLAKKGTTSQSSVDAAERAMLTSRSALQNRKNSLALLPSQKKLQMSRIAQSKRDLKNTKIFAPFDMNITGLQIENEQFVSKGQLLFSGNSIDQVEIISYVSLSDLRTLFYQSKKLDISIDQLESNLSNITQFEPTVYLDLGNAKKAQWKAKFLRFADEVDPQTRTMGVVVAVDYPLKKVIPGIRPPLSNGMFVEVAIAGRSQKDTVAIPSSALHDGSVYLMDEQNRLKIQKVELAYQQQGMSIIKSGLQGNERLVLSDLVPAIEGMLLKAP